MLSQRLAKAAQQASQGNLEAFKQLRESRDEFAGQMKLLLSGGEVGGVSLPATAGDARPVLDALDKEWQKNERNAGLVIAEERNLVGLGQAVRLMNDAQPGAAGAGRRGLGAQRADRRLGAAERDRRAAHDAHAAHGEERQHHAGRGGDRPAGLVPARQGRQQFPRHAAGAAPGQRSAAHPAGWRRGAARQARRARSRFQGIPACGRRHPRQPAAAGGRQARHLRPVPRQRKPAARRGAAEYRLRVAARGPARQRHRARLGLAARPAVPAADRQGVPG